MPRAALLSDALWFPPPGRAERDGLLAIGGDLLVDRLLLAYRSGIFPWYDDESPILWWSPPQRAVLRPCEAHFSRSLRKLVRRGELRTSFDTCFAQVIHRCATAPRRGDGTWIVPEMERAYVALHQAGHAHSVEVFQGEALVGGLYGVALGGMFFGESMFSDAPSASKVAFVALTERLVAWDFDLIDCQLENDHTTALGAHLIPRGEFLTLLAQSLLRPDRRGPWSDV